MSRILWAHTLAAPRVMAPAPALAGPRRAGPLAPFAFRFGLGILLTLALTMLGTCAHAATIIGG
jgi:hypothetical protein